MKQNLKGLPTQPSVVEKKRKISVKKGRFKDLAKKRNTKNRKLEGKIKRATNTIMGQHAAQAEDTASEGSQTLQGC